MNNEDKPFFVYRENMTTDKDYVLWLSDVKKRIVNARNKAMVRVNTALLELYWSIGRDLVNLHPEDKWGKGIVKQFALDLRTAFPNETGFSDTNVKYMRRWYGFYNQYLTNGYLPGDQIELSNGHLPGDQIEMPNIFGQIPWKHHVLISTKATSIEEAVYYIKETIATGWSRAQLERNIEAKLYHAQGTALTNFSETLPLPQGLLAQEILKDPYNFDFLTLKDNYNEKDLEDALIENITHFLLELGKGFAFVGRQMELQMPGGQTFFPDLIFYHIPQHRYVVIDLKAVEFSPEYAGKINFYVSAADELLKGEGDNDSIGLIICKRADKTVVEWTLRGIDRPLGIASYQLQEVVDRTFAEIKSKKVND